jgi:hypothetical protein
MKKPKPLVQIMDQSFFNRILHLVDARPKEGRRIDLLRECQMREFKLLETRAKN